MKLLSYQRLIRNRKSQHLPLKCIHSRTILQLVVSRFMAYVMEKIWKSQFDHWRALTLVKNKIEIYYMAHGFLVINQCP